MTDEFSSIHEKRHKPQLAEDETCYGNFVLSCSCGWQTEGSDESRLIEQYGNHVIYPIEPEAFIAMVMTCLKHVPDAANVMNESAKWTAAKSERAAVLDIAAAERE